MSSTFKSAVAGSEKLGTWGLICGLLKVKGNVHEIFSGLGLDFVASGIVIYLIIGPWKREGIANGCNQLRKSQVICRYFRNFTRGS